MNYPAMRWLASEDCKVKAPGRPILWVIAYHADHDTGECWLGQRRVARETGYVRSTVQEAMLELFGDGVLELLEIGKGPQTDRYRIAPALIEGEVIHRPAASGPPAGPQEVVDVELVDRLLGASGPMVTGSSELVDRSAEVTGPSTNGDIKALTRAKAELSESQGLKQGSLRSREVQVLGGGSTAAAAAAEVAYTPPEVSEADKAYLREKFGPRRPPPKSKSGQEQEAAP